MVTFTVPHAASGKGIFSRTALSGAAAKYLLISRRCPPVSITESRTKNVSSQTSIIQEISLLTSISCTMGTAFLLTQLSLTDSFARIMPQRQSPCDRFLSYRQLMYLLVAVRYPHRL